MSSKNSVPHGSSDFRYRGTVELGFFAYMFFGVLFNTWRHSGTEYDHIVWDKVNSYSPIIIPALALCYLFLNFKIYSSYINPKAWSPRNTAIFSVCQLTMLIACLSQCSWSTMNSTQPITGFMEATMVSGEVIFAWHTVKIAFSTFQLCQEARSSPS